MPRKPTAEGLHLGRAPSLYPEIRTALEPTKSVWGFPRFDIKRLGVTGVGGGNCPWTRSMRTDNLVCLPRESVLIAKNDVDKTMSFMLFLLTSKSQPGDLPRVSRARFPPSQCS